jgi:hypothetical protein
VSNVYSIALSPLHCREGGRVIHRVPGESPSVADVLDFLPELNSQGFRCWGPRTSISDSKHAELRSELLDGELSPAPLEQLNGWLSSFSPSRRWKQDSYALKHTFERETGTYVINGAFIVAVIMAGFEIKITAGPNALIKMQRAAL